MEEGKEHYDKKRRKKKLTRVEGMDQRKSEEERGGKNGMKEGKGGGGGGKGTIRLKEKEKERKLGRKEMNRRKIEEERKGMEKRKKGRRKWRGESMRSCEREGRGCHTLLPIIDEYLNETRGDRKAWAK